MEKRLSNTPPRLWGKLRAALGRGKSRVQEFFRRDFRLPVWRIRGEDLTAILIGAGAADEYANALMFGSGRALEPQPPVYFWNLRRFVGRSARTADFVWIKSSGRRLARTLGNRKTLVYPQFVTQALDIPAAVEDFRGWIKNPSNKNDLNKIRNLQCTYEISHDPAMLETFYERYHRPLILSRHGEAAQLEPAENLRRVFESGELLLVRRGGEIVSGVLVQHLGDNYSLRNNGVRDGDPALIGEAALSATYYFAIMEAQRIGCRTVDFVISAAFLHDEILQYKKKWNTRIRRSVLAEAGRELRLCVGNRRPPVLRFLRQNPFIVEFEGRLWGLVFFDRTLELSDSGLKSYLKKIGYPGLAALFIVLLDPPAADRAGYLREICPLLPVPLRLIDLSAAGDGDSGRFWENLIRKIGESEDLKPRPIAG